MRVPIPKCDISWHHVTCYTLHHRPGLMTTLSLADSDSRRLLLASDTSYWQKRITSAAASGLRGRQDVCHWKSRSWFCPFLYFLGIIRNERVSQNWGNYGSCGWLLLHHISCVPGTCLVHWVIPSIPDFSPGHLDCAPCQQTLRTKPGSLEWQFGNEECAKFVKCTLIFCTFSCNGRVTSIRIFLSWEEINNIWWGREAAPVRIRPRNTFTPDTNDQMTRPRSPLPAPHSDTPRHHQCLPAFISDNNWLSQSSLTVVGGEELSTEYTTQTSRLSDSH